MNVSRVLEYLAPVTVAQFGYFALITAHHGYAGFPMRSALNRRNDTDKTLILFYSLGRCRYELLRVNLPQNTTFVNDSNRPRAKLPLLRFSQPLWPSLRAHALFTTRKVPGRMASSASAARC